MRVTATDAKNRFGALCQQAKTGPVVIEKAGQPDTVLLSCSDCQRLVQPSTTTLATRRRQFNQQHREWLDAHNQQHDIQALWNEALRLW